MTLSLPPIVPGYAGAAMTALQVMVVLMNFSNEKNPETRTPYSKFAVQTTSKQERKSERSVSSRTGMLIIYAPAFILGTLVCSGTFTAVLPSTSPAAALCLVQFAKRVLEVLFLHKYSGNVGLSTSSMIGTYYALTTLLVCSVGEPNPPDALFKVGVALFTTGLLGNLYHHSLLASLRSSGSGSTKKYVVPQGGLFDFVAAPHYFFELVGWLGIAVVAHHTNAYLVFASMSTYLSGRAVSQNQWNREKFPEEWPSSRKNLVPFVY